MIRSHALWLTAALASACTRDAPPAKPAPAAPAPDPAVKTADDVLGFLPADAQIVLGLDARALRASAMYPEFRDELTARLRDATAKAKWECLHLETLERVTVGMHLDGEKHGVFVLREPHAPSLLACMRDSANHEHKPATYEAGVLTVKDTSGSYAATAVGDHTLVLEVSATASPASLARVLAGGAPLHTAAWFTPGFGHLEHGATLWAVIDGGVSVLQDAGVSASELDATIVVTDQVAITGRAALGNADTASQLAATLGGQLAQVRPFVDRLDVTAQGPLVRLDAAITTQQIRQLMMLLKMAD